MSAGTKFIWPMFSGVAIAVSTAATKKAIDRGWRFVTGTKPPAQPEHPDTPWPQAFGWAITGLVAGEAIRLLIVRRAAGYWRDRTGELPPQLLANKSGKDAAGRKKSGR